VESIAVRQLAADRAPERQLQPVIARLGPDRSTHTMANTRPSSPARSS